MKFALVNGERQEAQPNLSGNCPACEQAMIAKCGEVKIRHWAHKGRRTCDPWWENETEWHRAWKGQFPDDWQEFRHRAENGETHIADVKTARDWVIEFQHSYIKPEERRSRDSFYPKLVWVVNGVRRKRDRAQFLNAWNEGVPVDANRRVRRAFAHECVLIREWAGSHAAIFFDFGEEQVLWWLLSTSLGGPTYVEQFPRSDFIKIHRDGVIKSAHDFDELVKVRTTFVSDCESLLAQELRRASLPPLRGFQQHLDRVGKLRRRF